MRSKQTILATVLGLGLLAMPAAAQQASESAAFGDWAKQCEPAGNGGERCYLIQTVKAEGRPVMVVIVAYSPERDRVAAMIDVPLGMHLPTGLERELEGFAGSPISDLDIEAIVPCGLRQCCHTRLFTKLNGERDFPQRAKDRPFSFEVGNRFCILFNPR